jgi:hypothetical protein
VDDGHLAVAGGLIETNGPGCAYSLGRFSNTAMTPGSPRRAPSRMNSVARMLFPDPDGPATSTEYPEGMPPPNISSRPVTPTDSRGG